jgi:hypothetical protein
MSAIEKELRAACGLKSVHKVVDPVLKIESAGHRVTVFLVPNDKGYRGVAEAKQAAGIVIDNGSEPTTTLAERVGELSEVLCLVQGRVSQGPVYERGRCLHEVLHVEGQTRLSLGRTQFAVIAHCLSTRHTF